MEIHGEDGWTIEILGLGRDICDNGKAGDDCESLRFVDGRDGNRYVVLVAPNDRGGAMEVGTAEGILTVIRPADRADLTDFSWTQECFWCSISVQESGRAHGQWGQRSSGDPG